MNYVSRFQNSYNETHYEYALRVLKYSYKTKDLKLTYGRSMKNEIFDSYIDPDWAGDKVDRKSTIGFIIRFFGNVIYWKFRKQGSVTKSSIAAEFIAFSESVSNLTKNSKYIEIHYHFIKECYERKIIEIVKVDSENNLADIVTFFSSYYLGNRRKYEIIYLS